MTAFGNPLTTLGDAIGRHNAMTNAMTAAAQALDPGLNEDQETNGEPDNEPGPGSVSPDDIPST